MATKEKVKEFCDKKIKGKCGCGSQTAIYRNVNSNLSAFKHGDRYHENEMDKVVNIFRCSECLECIDKTFVPDESAIINQH